MSGTVFNANGGGLLSAAPLFTNAGTINVNNGTLQLANFPTNAGTINVAAGKTFSTGGNNLTNAAGGTLAGSGTFSLGAGTLTNAGVMSLNGATVNGNLANSGIFTSNGATTLNGLSNTNSGTLLVASGTLSAYEITQSAGLTRVDAGSTLALGAGNYNPNGGTLAGTGTITGDVFNNAGTVAPGASPGILTIAGNYTQGPGGTLEIELGGTGPGQLVQYAHYSEYV